MKVKTKIGKEKLAKNIPSFIDFFLLVKQFKLFTFLG